MKSNILIVGDFNRSDFLYLAKVLYAHYNIYFLEYTDQSEVASDEYKKWGTAIFWSEYKNAFALLDKIRPKFVLFYFIETFNHVALNVSCKHKGVRTFHIEHGIRDYEMLQANIDTIDDQASHTWMQFFGRMKSLRKRIKGRLFFERTKAMLPDPLRRFLTEYFQVRKTGSIFDTFRIVNSPLRIADEYISFSPKVFQFHQKSDHLPANYPVHFIGCPPFDFLATISCCQNIGNHILFIDNAFETQSLFGWNEEYKVQFLQQLVDVAVKQKKLWIKPHPYTKKDIYGILAVKPEVVLIEDEEDLIGAVKQCKIIIGIYSTLLMPLMAMAHTVCFSLKMHPTLLKRDPSLFLTDSGAIESVSSWEQLESSFQNLEEVFHQQKKQKEGFIKNWMYKFDGKSTERLKSILIDEIL